MIIVVDLDKTLLKVDSFPKWIFFHLRLASVSNPLLFLHLLMLTVRRAFRTIGHVQFKRKMMELLDRSDWNELFAKNLSKHINMEVIQYLKGHDRAKIVLSTAAPSQYVQYLLPYLSVGFDSVFASTLQHDSIFDNWGPNKVRSFQGKYATCDLLITDHRDDLPMMQLSTKTILVNPSETTLRMVKKAGVNIEQIIQE